MVIRLFESWLEDEMANQLRDATFGPAIPPEDRYLTHSFRQLAYVTAPTLDPVLREKQVREYLTFFEEIADKLQQQAAELVLGIEIEDDLTTQIVDVLRRFFEMVLSGDPSCAPYMHDKHPETADKLNNFVAIALVMGITIPEDFNDNKRRLGWLASVDAFENTHTGEDDEIRHIRPITDRFKIDEMYKNVKPRPDND